MFSWQPPAQQPPAQQLTPPQTVSEVQHPHSVQPLSPSLVNRHGAKPRYKVDVAPRSPLPGSRSPSPSEVGCRSPKELRRPSLPGLERSRRTELIEADEDYFLNTYKGEVFNYTQMGSKGGCLPSLLPPMVLDFFSIIDQGNEGILSADDLDEAADIIRIAKKAKNNNSAELNYKHMPKAVSEVLARWDADQSGSVGVAELVLAAEAQMKMSDENRLMRLFLLVAAVVILILMGSTFGLSFAAVEITKDSRPDSFGIQKLPDGRPLAVAEAIESARISDYASLPIEQLHRAQSVQIVTSSGWIAYRIASVHKSLDGNVTLSTLDGHRLGVSVSKIVTLNGDVISLVEEPVFEGAESMGFFAMTSAEGS